jgi:hypothetical protein
MTLIEVPRMLSVYLSLVNSMMNKRCPYVSVCNVKGQTVNNQLDYE